MHSINKLVVIGIVILTVLLAGCTLSDDQVQQYIQDHPEEVKAYVDSHGQQISQYLQDHPEILEQITIPPTVEPPNNPVTRSSEEIGTTTMEPTTEVTTAVTTEIPTTPQTTIPPTQTTVPDTTQTTAPTTEITTIATTLPTNVETTIPTTTQTTISITTTPTPNVTTIVTPVPTQTPYISKLTGWQAIRTQGNAWRLVTPQQGLSATLTASVTPNILPWDPNDPDSKYILHGTGVITGESNNATILNREGNPTNTGTYHGNDIYFEFVWTDNLDGTYDITALENPLNWQDKQPRTAIYSFNAQTEQLHFSGWPEGTYFVRP